MPDNPFENKARQKLDELKFVPSDAVWQKVEAQIRKDRNRRRRLVWLPLFCLFVAAGGWYFIAGKSTLRASKELVALAGQHKNNTDSFADQRSLPKEAPSAAPEKNNEGRTKGPVTPEPNRTTSLSTELKKTRHIPEQNRIDGNGYAMNLPSGKKGLHEADLANGQKELRQPEERQTPGENTVPAAEEKDQAGISAEPADTLSSRAAKPADSVASYYVTTGKKADSLNQKKLLNTESENTDSLQTVAAKKISGKKATLQWGFIGNAGLSSASRKFMHNYFSAAPSSANPPAAHPSLPSTRPAVSWGIGLQLEKRVSKTLSLFSGLHYTYSGIKIAKGQQVNLPLTIYAANYYLSSVSSYYQAAANGSYDYTSHFHFLEIPLGIEKQFGHRSRFSVNAGISFAWLFSTDALQYDPQSSIYFRDNSYFNKAQWNILGGIQYSLLKKEEYTLKIGPQVQYGLTGLLNKNSPYSEHLFSGGIQLLLIGNRK